MSEKEREDNLRPARGITFWTGVGLGVWIVLAFIFGPILATWLR